MHAYFIIDMHMNKTKLSRLKQSLAQLNKEAALLIDGLLISTPLMAGSVYEMKRRCGNENCACFLKNKLHESIVLSLKAGGKTKIKMLKPR